MNIEESEILIDPLIAEGQNFKPPTGVSKQILCLLESVKITYPESLDHTKERCKQFLNKIIKDQKSCVVFTHGIIYNMLLQNLFPHYKFDAYLKSKDYIPHYCDTTVLEFNEKGDWNIIYSDIEL